MAALRERCELLSTALLLYELSWAKCSPHRVLDLAHLLARPLQHVRGEGSAGVAQAVAQGDEMGQRIALLAEHLVRGRRVGGV